MPLVLVDAMDCRRPFVTGEDLNFNLELLLLDINVADVEAEDDLNVDDDAMEL